MNTAVLFATLLGFVASVLTTIFVAHPLTTHRVVGIFATAFAWSTLLTCDRARVLHLAKEWPRQTRRKS